MVGLIETIKKLYPPGTKFKTMICNTICTIPLDATYHMLNYAHTPQAYVCVDMINLTLFKDNVFAEKVYDIDIDEIQILEF